MNSDSVVTVAGLSKKFSRGMRNALKHGAADIARELTWWRDPPSQLRNGEFWALKDISFDLERGGSLAVIGANGAGKSTLLKLISGLLKPDQGCLRVRGRLRAMIELGAAFNPVLTGRENIFAQGSLYGYRREDLVRQIDSIVDFAGIESFIDSPVQQYSDGMRARLGFAIAVNLDPDVLVVDEVLAVGDIAFQNKCLRYIREYLDGGGSLVFVGHASHQVQSACKTGIVLDHGKMAFSGGVVEALDFYLKAELAPRDRIPALESGFALPRDRVAAHDVVITRVDVQASVDAEPIATGSTIIISVDCESASPVPNISLGFTFYTGDGSRPVAGGLVSPPVTLKAGVNVLRCLVPMLALLPGAYLLRLYLFDWSVSFPVALSGWEDSPYEVVVHADPHAFSNVSAMAGVHVFMDAAWSGNQEIV